MSVNLTTEMKKHFKNFQIDPRLISENLVIRLVADELFKLSQSYYLEYNYEKKSTTFHDCSELRNWAYIEMSFVIDVNSKNISNVFVVIKRPIVIENCS